MESTPIQIYTDSEIGSGEKLWVQFSDSTGDVFGGISVDFTFQPTYGLGYCDSQVQISPTKLGPNINRVWTIVKWGTNVKLYCGGVQIFDIKTHLSEKTSCRTRWALHSSKFQCAGTAADFYREHRSGKNRIVLFYHNFLFLFSMESGLLNHTRIFRYRSYLVRYMITINITSVNPD